jgi:hypothetical protein
MDDSDPLRKAEVTRDLYDVDESFDICLHSRGGGLGSHCQLDVHLGSRDSHVCRIM